MRFEICIKSCCRFQNSHYYMFFYQYVLLSAGLYLKVVISSLCFLTVLITSPAEHVSSIIVL